MRYSIGKKEKFKKESINEKKLKSSWIPMIIVQIYLTIILILFNFGPWPWPVDNLIQLNFYLILSQMMLFVGYLLSIKSKLFILNISRTNKSKLILNISNNNIRFIKFLFVITVLLYIPTFILRIGIDSFNISVIFLEIKNGIINPGEQYLDKINSQGSTEVSMINTIISAIYAPFYWLLVPLSLVNWKRLTYFLKLGLIFLILLEILSWVSIGTNKGIFDTVFILTFSLIIKVYLDNYDGDFNKKYSNSNSKKKFNIFIFFGLFLLLAITYMYNAISSRTGSISNYNAAANITVDFNSPIMSIVPSFLEDIVIMLSSYLTQGYYGLSLAMNEGFTSTYGFGNSWFLLNVYEQITGDETLVYKTYPFKIVESGWDPFINWHSIYTWLASDYSFIGVLILMTIIGYLFGEVWKSLLIQRNIFSFALFILFMIMFMYFPANNQIFAFIQTFSAFWVLFILWILSTRIRV
ncbi:hypothetical protein [Cytobacillus firmus]|uniref:hypothetical protein n=1 Tax=Cytobacillus firmus TaxID=1399 RepID=UPI001C97CD46|nr:hypothetical protein [Cytobacillus firmus]MBY6052631.1 hypothetical protein [Cytobacillus firmus]